MRVELLGGPQDGAVIDVVDGAPYVLATEQAEPIYEHDDAGEAMEPMQFRTVAWIDSKRMGKSTGAHLFVYIGERQR